MEKDGTILKNYVQHHRLSRINLAKQLGISKQGLYQLYKSKEFSADTIGRVEKAMGHTWKDIKGNVAVNVPHGTAEVKAEATATTSQDAEVTPGRASLERSIEILSEDKLRNTAIIERLVTLLENQLSSGNTGKGSVVPDPTGIAAGHPAKGDLGMDNKRRALKGRSSEKDNVGRKAS